LLFKDDEFKTYLGFILFAGAILTALLMASEHYINFDAIRHAFFQIVSLMTSSGFASADYTKWSSAGKLVLFIAIFFGSCASSAGGGIKITRWLLVCKIMKNEIIKILHPNAVIPVKYNNKAVPADVLRQIIIFIVQYFLIIAISSVIISLLENNHVLGFTAAVTALGNVGPAFGQIGPMGSFEHLHTATKITLILNMLIGRLELIPFLVMLNLEFWQIKKD
ncbi:MAG: TrkH family potassium uptake protein, partial [Alphaproteobacteria bacterium]|nr:TrkH family potassium uptake protein [Alphaproteobacteria bacterium]